MGEVTPATATSDEQPAFLDELPEGAPMPKHFTLVSARELYDLRPGERLDEALQRVGRETAG